MVSVSWIPSEAVKGMTKLPFELGMTNYDSPPPDVIDDLESLRGVDGFRFANELAAWAEFDEASGQVMSWGVGGTPLISPTQVGRGKASVVFEPVALPQLDPEPEVGDGSVRFQRTAGGRTGMPAPRHVNRPPFVKYQAPLAWTTLSLTLRADGTSEGSLAGASAFPRHWVYGPDRQLVAKSGLIDFSTWYRDAFGAHTPWGEEDSPAFVTEVETALERRLSSQIMRGGARPQVRKLKADHVLVEQGAEGRELFLVLDGVLRVDVDGEPVAELGPGAVIGERAVLEGGRRTATLVAVTPCKVAVAAEADIDLAALEQLREGHRREDVAPSS